MSKLELRIFDGSRQLFSAPAKFLITITDGNGLPISKGGMAGLHHLFSKGLMAVCLGMLVVCIVYAWQLAWVTWQSMPPRPPSAPNGNSIPLI